MHKKRTTLSVVSFLLLAGLWSGVATAQGDKRKATIDFEDELIEGEVKKPELFYLLNKKQFNFKRLIKLRKNFIPEMERTSEELRHTGRDK
ncbi:MAG: hypothetical protein AAF202_12450 [Pseudomonadota bacterium]